MDFYNKSNMTYSEIAIALEDFTYGEDVKMTIPVLLPLVNYKDEPTSTTTYISNKNILNKNKDNLKVGKVTTNNFITLNVPKDLCPCFGIDEECEHSGLKGQKFIVNFIGGNINKPIIYRRYD